MGWNLKEVETKKLRAVFMELWQAGEETCAA